MAVCIQGTFSVQFCKSFCNSYAKCNYRYEGMEIGGFYSSHIICECFMECFMEYNDWNFKWTFLHTLISWLSQPPIRYFKISNTYLNCDPMSCNCNQQKWLKWFEYVLPFHDGPAILKKKRGGLAALIRNFNLNRYRN